MGYPRTHDEFSTKRFGIVDHALRVIDKILVACPHTHHAELVFCQHGLELVHAVAVGSSTLDLTESHLPDLSQCSRDVLFEFMSQAVQLQSYDHIAGSRGLFR